MSTALFTDPIFWQHDTGAGHPESSHRLTAIETALQPSEFDRLLRLSPPKASLEQIGLVHQAEHIKNVLQSIPSQGHSYLDPDTVISPQSGEAALYGSGAACAAIDGIMRGEFQNAFCAVRPPGHHAEPDQAMGFCLFNHIAIAARYAQHHYSISKVAIIDFDVHHGNGSQAAFYNDSSVFYGSIHQSALYPGTGHADERGRGNILNIPLAGGSSGAELRPAFSNKLVPALNNFQPNLLLISAGFDAHHNDPLASLNYEDADYEWMTKLLLDIARQHCQSRLISFLEGGYDTPTLGRCVAAHIKQLMQAN